MARMYGAYARPCCQQCRSYPSRVYSGQRWREERQWRREVEQDIRDVEEELQFASFLEAVWLPDWYRQDCLDRANLIWVRL